MVKFVLQSFLWSVLGLSSAWAGFASTVFEEIPLDSSLRCDRIPMRAASQYRNTAVLIPQMIPGSILEGKDAYTVRNHPQPNGNKKYLLNIRIFFPTHDDLSMMGRTVLSSSELRSCDLDHIKPYINRHLPPSEQIQTFAKSSLSGAEMTIPGIEGKATLGSLNLDGGRVHILDYSGKFLTFTFAITENERKYFQEYVVSKNGLLAKVLLYFQTRSKQNAFSVRMNRDEVLKNFKGHFSGGPAQMLTQAEVSLAVKSAVKNAKIEVIQEGSLAPEAEKLKIDVANQILEQMKTNLIAPSDSTVDSMTPADKPESKKISVKMAGEYIANAVNFEFSFANYSEPINAIAERQIDLASYRTSDPNLVEIKLRPREGDPATGIEVKAGQMISIALAYYENEVIKFVDDKRYVSKSRLDDFKFRDAFPKLRERFCVVDNDTVNGETFATTSFHLLCPHKYRWGYILRTPKAQTVSSGMAELNPQKFEGFPVKMAFDGINKSRLFTFDKLVNIDNEYFSTYFEESSSKLMIVAKRDLGRLFLRILARDGSDYLKIEKGIIVNTQALFQEDYSVYGNRKDGLTQEVATKAIDSYVSFRQSLTFNVSRPVTLTADDLKYLKGLRPQPSLNLK